MLEFFWFFLENVFSDRIPDLNDGLLSYGGRIIRRCFRLTEEGGNRRKKRFLYQKDDTEFSSLKNADTQ